MWSSSGSTLTSRTFKGAVSHPHDAPSITGMFNHLKLTDTVFCTLKWPVGIHTGNRSMCTEPSCFYSSPQRTNQTQHNRTFHICRFCCMSGRRVVHTAPLMCRTLGLVRPVSALLCMLHNNISTRSHDFIHRAHQSKWSHITESVEAALCECSYN